MTDRELLELAAKAAGVIIDHWGQPDYYSDRYGEVAYINSGDKLERVDEWNPLTDDGDALRLAVKVGIFVAPKVYRLGPNAATSAALSLIAMASFNTDPLISPDSSIDVYHRDHAFDSHVATRRAIVRAAAEIGKGM